MALAESGTCGTNLTWTLDGDGTLTISGTGDMEDYTDNSNAPWYGNSSIKSVVVENGVTNIGNCAFLFCARLTSVTVPDSVMSIGDYAFRNCSGLTSVTIPDSVTSIGDYAFYGCSSLTSVTIPNSVTSIGDGAFSSCDSLEKFEVDSNNNNYSSSDGVLFNKDKSKLIAYPNSHGTTYEIPNSVTSIGYIAFEWCESLESITIPNSVTSIGNGAFLGCESLSSVTIEDGVTSIGDYAFNDCENITSVIIPNSVTDIGAYAFEDCYSLESVTIGDSVTSIGESTFEWCDNLTDIYYAGSEDEWNSISIESNNDYLTNATIHYNADSKSSGGIWNNVTDFLISICQKISGFFRGIVNAF
jgi:hypothetical protein